MSKLANPHSGSTLDDFLEEEGIREEVTTAAIKKVIAWQLAEEMKKKSITKGTPGRADAHQPRPDRPHPRPRQGQRDARNPPARRLAARPAITAGAGVNWRGHRRECDGFRYAQPILRLLHLLPAKRF